MAITIAQKRFQWPPFHPSFTVLNLFPKVRSSSYQRPKTSMSRTLHISRCLCISCSSLPLAQHVVSHFVMVGSKLCLFGFSHHVVQEYSSPSGSEEDIVMHWLQDITGLLLVSIVSKPDSFHQNLRSGVVLCQAANKIMPNAVPKISMQDKPFNQRENISAFINFLRRVGVAEKDLFGTEDLFEGKNMRQVVISLLSLGRALYKVPNYSGPSPSRPETLRRRSTFEVRQDGLWGKAGGQFGQVRPRS